MSDDQTLRECIDSMVDKPDLQNKLREIEWLINPCCMSYPCGNAYDCYRRPDTKIGSCEKMIDYGYCECKKWNGQQYLSKRCDDKLQEMIEIIEDYFGEVPLTKRALGE